ncbi:MAG TPA: two-component regulator propeller domain-containing protein [Saprospiraceae bacterium]|nr:two-component regulator propeller domain-containing protein [Saprospiraceae bacterium]
MTNQLFIALFSILLCGIYLPSAAQQYGYVQYNADSGAPFQQVSSVVQDQEGFVWIGSDRGLYRFDGIDFDLFSLHTQSQYIHQLQTEGDHLFFVNDLSIYQIDNTAPQPEAKALVEGSTQVVDTLPFYPNNFILDKEQGIWISQSNHRMGHLKNGVFKSYTFPESDKAQKLAIQKDAEGNIWVLSALSGLFLLDETTDRFQKRLDIKGGKTLLIHQNHLLVGNEALRVYSLSETRLLAKQTIPLNNDSITALQVDQSGQYLVGTQKGKLMRFSDLDQAPQIIYGANEAHRVEQLNFGTIHEIYTAPDSISDNGKLWICSETGLWLLQQRFFKTVKNLPMNNPISIEIGDDQRVWVPMNYLYEITAQGEAFTARPVYNNLQVNAVARDKDGFTWITKSTPRVELLKYREKELIKRYDFHERGEAIFNLYPDRQGNLWFCQAPLSKPILGLARINTKGEIDYYGSEQGFFSRVLTIQESARGEIYAAGIGKKTYLYRYDPQENHFINLSPELPFEPLLNFEVHDLTIDERGVVWLATTDGLLRYDSEQITLIQNDLLRQEEVRGVTHYANNNIWVATATEGLIFHQGNSSTALGEQEGLPAVISAYRCLATDAQGRLWFGTPEGLVYSRLSAATLPYSNPPKLMEVRIQEQAITHDLDQAILLPQPQQLQLAFTNLSFPAKNVQYQYRLLPTADRAIMLEEQVWQSNGKRNILRLSQVPAGDYLLEVRARQPGGYQWSAPVELSLTVFVPWYLRSWFLYGLVVLLLILTAYYFRFYVRRRFRNLRRGLKYSKEELANKETQLQQTMQEFEAQKEELAHATSNIQTLELFIREIPKKASWNDVITAMSKAVNQADDINAFEIAFKEGAEIVHRGYSNMERSGFTFRSKAFNPQTSLTCWAMVHNKEVLINNFKQEHTTYIKEKEAYYFSSLLFIPFKLDNDQAAVLCAYSVEENDFDQNDLVMFRILAQFLHFSIHQQLKKHL